MLLASVAAAGCSDDDSDSAAASRTSPTTTGARDGSQPAGSVIVRVGDAEISQAKYDRDLRRIAAGYATARTLPGRRYYVPPDYTLCIENRREWGSVPADWPASRVRIQCRRNHGRLRRSILRSLIVDEWLDQEAARLRIDPPSDPTARITELPTQLAEAGVRKVDMHVSDAEIDAYYERHRSYLRRPEQRPWRAVLSGTRAKAEQARKALERGVGWAAVARRYGDPNSGSAPQDWIATPDNAEPQLTKAVFAAPTGALIGPIATESGFYVLTVGKLRPAHQFSLEASRKAIVPVLRTRHREAAQIRYWRDLRLTARAHTVCLGELTLPECSNGRRNRFDAAGGQFGYTNPRPVLPTSDG